MEMQFKKAERKRGYANIGLCGPSGAGKTFTALALATGLCKDKSGKIAVIDSENESSTLYSDLFTFDTLAAKTGDPQFYFQALKAAAVEGYEVVIIDSATPLWEGADGLLDKQGEREKITKNSYTSWKDITPIYRDVISSFRNSPFHLICNFRAKTEYVIEQNEKGKMAPRKVGMAPIFRAAVEYEFDMYAELDWDNNLTVSKSRVAICPQGRVIHQPTAAMGEEIRDWLYSGKEVSQAEKLASYVIKTKCSLQNKPLGEMTRAGIGLILASHADKLLPDDLAKMNAWAEYLASLELKEGK